MKVYSIDVMICGTAYIKASSKRAAMRKILKLKTAGLEVASVGASEVAVSDLPYEHPDLPVVSLSPAMTLHDIWPAAELEIAP